MIAGGGPTLKADKSKNFRVQGFMMLACGLVKQYETQSQGMKVQGAARLRSLA